MAFYCTGMWISLICWNTHVGTGEYIRFNIINSVFFIFHSLRIVFWGLDFLIDILDRCSTPAVGEIMEMIAVSRTLSYHGEILYWKYPKQSHTFVCINTKSSWELVGHFDGVIWPTGFSNVKI